MTLINDQSSRSAHKKPIIQGVSVIFLHLLLNLSFSCPFMKISCLTSFSSKLLQPTNQPGLAKNAEDVLSTIIEKIAGFNFSFLNGKLCFKPKNQNPHDEIFSSPSTNLALLFPNSSSRSDPVSSFSSFLSTISISPAS